ncbi:MAG TPA: haloalkane dehalogenase, partial [Polyangiales bacterium]
LWRKMIEALSARYRCMAPDLIGMGDSDKLPESGPAAYSFADHSRFLDGWFDAVAPSDPVILVMHDWGAALGLDWARRNPTRVRAVAYMEAVLGALPSNSLPAPAAAFFAAIRSAEGERLVLQDNVFLERMLTPESILRPLSDAERDAYRRPFREPGEGRRPTLTWPRLLPFDGEPAHIVAIAAQYRAWLARSAIPKLLVVAEPGRILTPAMRALCASFPNQREVTVPGLHYPQEDSPEEVTSALREWLREVAS